MNLFLLAVAVGCWALAWVRILPAGGHLLAPVQYAWRLWYRRRYGAELDDAWWWAPVWGCAGCHSVWVGSLCYIRFYHASYDPLLHLLTAAVGIITACLLSLIWNKLA